MELAKPAPGFVEIEPVQESAPTEPTDVKIIYNRQYYKILLLLREFETDNLV